MDEESPEHRKPRGERDLSQDVSPSPRDARWWKNQLVGVIAGGLIATLAPLANTCAQGRQARSLKEYEVTFLQKRESYASFLSALFSFGNVVANKNRYDRAPCDPTKVFPPFGEALLPALVEKDRQFFFLEPLLDKKSRDLLVKKVDAFNALARDLLEAADRGDEVALRGLHSRLVVFVSNDVQPALFEALFPERRNPEGGRD